MENPQIVAMIFQAEFASQAAELDVADCQVRLAGGSVGYHRPLHTRQDRLHVGLVEAQNHRAVKWHAIDELQEHILNFLERVVMVQMLTVNGGDDGDHRREQQERAVTLVSFNHHVFALAHARVRTGVIHAPADDESGIKARSRENRRDHRGGSSFSVRAGHRDAVFQAHQFREHFRARNHWNFQQMRFDYLYVISTHRRRNHHDMRAVHVFRMMSCENTGAKLAKPLGDLRLLQIRAGNRVAARKQHFRDAGHAAAANADQMNALKIAKRNVHARTSPSSRSTISSTARGRAKHRARSSISVILRGWSRRVKISFVKRSGVSSVCGSRRAAPAFCMASALRIWCASVAAPKGMKMAARPAAATSAVVIAPERQRIKSAWAKRSAIFSMKGTTSARNSRRA